MRTLLNKFGYSVLAFLLGFVLPSHFFLKLCHACGYVGGLLSDYLIPKLYLSDILLFLFIVIGCIEAFFRLHKLSKLHNTRINIKLSRITHALLLLLGLIWIALGIMQMQTEHPIVGFLQWLRLTGGVGLVWILTQHNQKKIISAALLFGIQSGAVFQMILAWYQWIQQKSLVGYWLLGEPTISQAYGITKQVIAGVEYILPYGTTAHPNVLAGFLAIGVVLTSQQLLQTALIYRSRFFENKQEKQSQENLTLAGNNAAMPFTTGAGIIFQLCLIIASVATIYVTRSASALLTLVFGCIGLGVFGLRTKIGDRVILILVGFIALILVMSVPITSSLGSAYEHYPSLYRRGYLIDQAMHIIGTHSQKIQWWGSGLGQFTAAAPTALLPHESARFNQPVHHVPLLFIVETGFLGFTAVFITLLVVLMRYYNTINTQKNNTHITEKCVITKENGMRLLLVLAIFTPLFIWDHYILSFPVGIYLIALTMNRLSIQHEPFLR